MYITDPSKLNMSGVGGAGETPLAQKNRTPSLKVRENEEANLSAKPKGPAKRRNKTLISFPKAPPVSQEEIKLENAELAKLKQTDTFRYLQLKHAKEQTALQRQILEAQLANNSAIVESNGEIAAAAQKMDLSADKGYIKDKADSIWKAVLPLLKAQIEKTLSVPTVEELTAAIDSKMDADEEKGCKLNIRTAVLKSSTEYINHRRGTMKDLLHRDSNGFYSDTLKLDSLYSVHDLKSLDFLDQKWSQMYAVAWHILVLEKTNEDPIDFAVTFSPLQCEFISSVWVNYKTYNVKSENALNPRSLDFAGAKETPIHIQDESEAGFDKSNSGSLGDQRFDTKFNDSEDSKFNEECNDYYGCQKFTQELHSLSCNDDHYPAHSFNFGQLDADIDEQDYEPNESPQHLVSQVPNPHEEQQAAIQNVKRGRGGRGGSTQGGRGGAKSGRGGAKSGRGGSKTAKAPKRSLEPRKTRANKKRKID